MIDVMRPHTDPPAREWEDRFCVCNHDYGDHGLNIGPSTRRRGDVPCDEKGCDCREFQCWQHPDGDCIEPPREGSA